MTLPIWSASRAVRPFRADAHGRDAFATLCEIEGLDKWGRANATDPDPNQAPDLNFSALPARATPPRSRPGAAAGVQPASTSLQCGADIFDATAREAGAVNDLDDRLALFQQLHRPYDLRW